MAVPVRGEERSALGLERSLDLILVAYRSQSALHLLLELSELLALLLALFQLQVRESLLHGVLPLRICDREARLVLHAWRVLWASV